MATKIIALNWKLNSSYAHIEDFFENLINCKEDQNLIVCPPQPYLEAVRKKTGLLHRVFLGCQNVSEHEKGAYTGETSANMARDIGVNYVIVGHSERRQFHHESEEQIKNKLKQVYKQGLDPILCVGETYNQRESIYYRDVINKQLDSIAEMEVENPIIAYEPVWAIGTGKIPTNKEIEEIAKLIKERIPSSIVLYGGSVKSDNAEEILNLDRISGLLVGSAGLKHEEVNKILALDIL